MFTVVVLGKDGGCILADINTMGTGTAMQGSSVEKGSLFQGGENDNSGRAGLRGLADNPDSILVTYVMSSPPQVFFGGVPFLTTGGNNLHIQGPGGSNTEFHHEVHCDGFGRDTPGQFRMSVSFPLNAGSRGDAASSARPAGTPTILVAQSGGQRDTIESLPDLV